MPQTLHILIEQTHQEQPAAQIKVCSACHNHLLDSAGNNIFFLPDTDAILCSACRDHVLATRAALVPTIERSLCDEVETECVRRTTQGVEANGMRSTRQTDDSHAIEEDTEMGSTYSSTQSNDSSYPHPPISNVSHTQSSYAAPTTPPASSHRPQNTSSLSSVHPTHCIRHQDSRSFKADPLIDITRLRVRSQGRHCLYPGATFSGTQKSGRNSYDVNVTIVDVDFSKSHLCGYLQIRGLTDDWPELTTYFDAEIIGTRYGFLTQNWGANEEEDMTHWSRFPAFQAVKHDLKQPYLTMPDKDRGAVFMRWKERFLVPDHRVQDISGASFAGFYYVCVDFNPSASRTHATSEAEEYVYSSPHSLPEPRSDRPHCGQRNSNVRKAPSLSPRISTSVATMDGYYFHQNSEPYQQLSLCHVPERTSTSFEFR